MIPQDPVMLLSYVNLKLRDQYQSLDAMCDDLDIDPADITNRLQRIGYSYDSQRNQFTP